jgi:type VI secretion system protein ImpA
MPIGPELLTPIPGENPSGANLRYDPVYDKIKEARREEEALSQGDWAREIKKADWPLVIKLSTQVLTSKSKDLQIAVWLAEAQVAKEGFSGLRQGLDLCRQLVEQFWDTLYPENEDGDLELRATPLEWLGSRFDDAIKKIPLTKSGYDWYKYKESRTVGYEADAGGSDQKRAAREQAIADGKATAEDFDKAVLATSKDGYKQKLADIDGAMEDIDALAQACETRFGDFNPSFSALRGTLEEVRVAVKAALAKKLEQEPDPVATPVMEPGAESSPGFLESVLGPGTEATSVSSQPGGPVAPLPVDKADAYERVVIVARWLRKQDASNPIPYLLLRALRWGELRGNGTEISLALLEPPPQSVRLLLRKLAAAGSWSELIDACENAMVLPCGRAWLDLQRYFLQACEKAGGYEGVSKAVLSELKALLAEYPNLSKMTLLDDTGTANPETLAWLEEMTRASS